MKNKIALIATSTLMAMIAFMSASPAKDNPLKGQTLRFCGDGAGWPPYTYMERKKGLKTNTVVGYDIDVLKEILHPLGIGVLVEMPSWKRCLFKTKARGGYDVALSASHSRERAETFLMTEPYYVMHSHYYYDKRKFPGPSPAKTLEDLAKLGNICGLNGYNYEGMGISNDRIDRGAKDFPAVIGKTMAGRCAAFLARKEILLGFKSIGIDLLADPNLASAPVPGAKPDAFYMLISRNYDHAEVLKVILNDGFKRLRKSGRLDALFAKHTGN
jgi:polar amino acid transport system substrate-binding protein